MEVVKKNLFTIICAAVAVLAVLAVFMPLNGLFQKLNDKVAKSREDYDQLTNVSSKKFKLPITNPRSTETADLPQFPTDRIIKKAQEIVDKVHEESAKRTEDALRMNRHQPLVSNALPDGKGVPLSEFKERYHAYLKQLIARMNATPPVTEPDIREEEAKVRADWEKRIINGPQGSNEQEVMAKFTEVAASLPVRMKADRAKKFSMYVSSERALDMHQQIPQPEDRQVPDIVDVWIAQVGLWIQEDIVSAIIETNRNSIPQSTGPVTVENAVVKRLVKIQIPKEYVTKGTQLPMAQAADMNAGAMPPPGLDEATPTKQYTISMTGRYSNPTYDVMHFTLIMDLDALRFSEFFANLERNRFITILRADMRGVDLETAQRRGYVYGKNPVVTITMKCEVVLFRDWTKPLMPANIKKLLLIPDATPAATDSKVAAAQ